MGASFNQIQVPGSCGKVEVETRFGEAQARDRIDNGNSYSGGIGMATGIEFRSQSFPSIQTAQDWLEENAQKWGPALAVTATDNREKLWDAKANPGFGKPVWVIGAWCSS